MAIINGTAGNDTLNGTSGADQIFGLGGDDILNGNGGNDQLDGGTGADTMTGGTGSDIYFVDDIGDVVVELSGQGNDEVRATLAAYTLGSDVEKLRFTGVGSFTGTGNDLNNEIFGGASSDTLYGNDGWDQLYGNGGDDFLYGGADGDVLNGGTGADYMEGNSGDDVYIVDSALDTVVEAAAEGVDHVYTSLSSYTLGANVENLTWNGGPGLITVTGNSSANVVSGSSGADTLNGNDGNDELRGQSGDDVLDGGNGDDLLVGGSGVDTYTGGADADTFQINFFSSGTGSAADIITDLQSGVDLIDLANWDGDLNTGGNQAFTFVGTSAFSSTAGELRYHFDGTNTWVQGDIDGDGAANFEVMLSGNVTPLSTDFVL